MYGLIFLGIIIAFAVTGGKNRFLESFASAIAGMYALYFSFWQLEPVAAFWEMKAKAIGQMALLLPEWNPPIIFVLLYTASFLVFRNLLMASVKLLEKKLITEDRFFSKTFCRIGNGICRGFYGLTLATLLFLMVYFCSSITSGLAILEPAKSASVARKGIQTITFVVDRLSFQSGFGKQRSKVLDFCFEQLSPEESEFMDQG